MPKYTKKRRTYLARQKLMEEAKKKKKIAASKDDSAIRPSDEGDQLIGDDPVPSTSSDVSGGDISLYLISRDVNELPDKMEVKSPLEIRQELLKKVLSSEKERERERGESDCY